VPSRVTHTVFIYNVQNPLGTAETAAGLDVVTSESTEGKTTAAADESQLALKTTTREQTITTTVTDQYVDYVSVVTSSMLVDNVVMEVERVEEAPTTQSEQRIEIEGEKGKREEYTRFANIERNAEEYTVLVLYFFMIMQCF
jgi:hypothetical protein